MREKVTIDGVTLTAEQVKKAWEELNKPEETFAAKLTSTGDLFAVLDNCGHVLQPGMGTSRWFGEYAGRGIYLGHDSVVECVKDSEGCWVLIKKGTKPL